MKYLTKIAIRNLSRNWHRSLIAVLAIAAAVMIVVFARGFLLGFTEATFKIYIDNFSGHVKLISPRYQNREMLLTLNHPIDGIDGKDLATMVSQLQEIESVEHVLPRLKFAAMISLEDKLLRMMGIGVDPSSENNYGALPEDIQEGRMVETSGEIVVGRGLLQELKADIGDRFTFLFSDAYNSLQARTFTIVGIRDTGLEQLDENTFFVNLSEAQDMLYMKDEATELMIFTNSYREADVLADDIQNFLQENNVSEKYTVFTWDKADPFIEYFNAAIGIYDFIYVFFILLGCIVVINTMIMIIRERTNEIGMMAALGLKRSDIIKLFTTEGALIGLIGSLLGALIGGVVTYYLSIVGLDYYSELVGDMGDIIMVPVVYPVFNLQNLLFSFALGAVITILASLLPARKAALLETVQALHKDV